MTDYHHLLANYHKYTRLILSWAINDTDLNRLKLCVGPSEYLLFVYFLEPHQTTQNAPRFQKLTPLLLHFYFTINVSSSIYWRDTLQLR